MDHLHGYKALCCLNMWFQDTHSHFTSKRKELVYFVVVMPVVMALKLSKTQLGLLQNRHSLYSIT
jgi:hypothetical protein